MDRWGAQAVRRSKLRRRADTLLAVGGVIFAVGVAVGRLARLDEGSFLAIALSLLAFGGAVLAAGAFFRWQAQRQ